MELPRLLTPDVLWTGGCVELEIRGERMHSHFGSYVVRGSRASIMVDTGHPMHARQIERALDNFLGGEQPEFIFPTHLEYPHCGLLPKWLHKYPGAKVIGDVRDYELHYPEHAGRFIQKQPGECVDLGDRNFVVVPAIWCDLKETLWGFDSKDRILFVADGFSATHHHLPGHCGLTAGEQPIPDPAMMRIINELALQWTRYTDASTTFDELDELLTLLQPRIIAPAHGAVIDRPDIMVPRIKEAMCYKAGPQSGRVAA
jgi:flavorubredoxin